MTCIFLWFCILIYPHRRRKHFKQLIRVKSSYSINESIKDGETQSNIENIPELGEVNSPRDPCDNGSSDSSVQGQSEPKQSQVHYHRSKEVPCTSHNGFHYHSDMPKDDWNSKKDSKTPMDSHLPDDLKLMAPYKENKAVTNPIENRNHDDSDKGKRRHQSLSNGNQKGLQEYSEKLDKGERVSSEELQGLNKLKSTLPKDNVSLILKVSSDILSQPSNDVKKLRREPAFEGPCISTHL